MAKHASKRRKTSKGVKEIQPLGANLLTDDASKDDEERRLESMLFGTKFTPRENNDVILLRDGDEDEVEEGGQEMNNLMDTDVSLSLLSIHTTLAYFISKVILCRRWCNYTRTRCLCR